MEISVNASKALLFFKFKVINTKAQPLKEQSDIKTTNFTCVPAQTFEFSLKIPKFLLEVNSIIRRNIVMLLFFLSLLA